MNKQKHSVLEEYHDVFCLEDGERGETDILSMRIDTREEDVFPLPGIDDLLDQLRNFFLL